MKATQQETIEIPARTMVIDTKEPAVVVDHYTQILRCAKIANLPRKSLYCGDYWIVGEKEEVLIERKNLADLYASFSNRRLDSEVAKMLNWARARQENFPDKVIRARLMIVGSYLDRGISMRLLTYQKAGLEVIWGEDGARLLVWQFESVIQGKHKDPRVRQITSCAKKLALRDQVLAPVLNAKQRAFVFKSAQSKYLGELCDLVIDSPKEVQKWPGFGPATVKKLREAFDWRQGS